MATSISSFIAFRNLDVSPFSSILVFNFDKDIYMPVTDT
jgi:hypothetical protein